ncbi:DUF2652 domain-containing protein [Fulvivirgaceae bacterium BMA10]|uniref:DUF2652 domain-containing protein n=1 Tax=Splendidivirga corallicola TaxID=3051826 RepID=A0ABT8KS03_9BACT|nr:DUF2652 domain-containing protein [Fulvivirgaceae bacterium BMA10]
MASKKQSLLFIPDITGFTEFVNETEVQHGQHIISELLEIIIDSNELEMKVSEIEGDAVLFFKHNEVPTFEEILEQVQKTFLNFHNHLKKYESRRICPCGACSTAINLSLKFVVHQGEIGFTKVKNIEKPFGSDLILVHKLLKNDVDSKDYVLLTNSFLPQNGELKLHEPFDWVKLNQGKTNYAKIGEVSYQYLSLNHLKQFITVPVPPPPPEKMKNPVRDSAFINGSMQSIFEEITNLENRLNWIQDVNELEFEKGKMNRIGTRHRCVLNNGVADFETVTNDFGKDKLVYGEHVLNAPLMKEMYIYFILEEQQELVNLTAELHFKAFPVIGWIITPIIRKKMLKNLQRMLKGIKAASERAAA